MHEPWAPRLSGKKRSWLAAVSCRVCRMQPGLDGHRIADRIDFEHVVHAAERQHDAAMGRPRRGAAHQAGVAALRHDGDAVVVAKLHDLGDLLDCWLAAPRPRHCRCACRASRCTKGCLSCSSRIRPLSPTMARKLSARRASPATVGMTGAMTVSGMFPRFCRQPSVRRPAVIRGGPAQAVVDRMAETRFRNGHDRDAADAGPVERRAAGRRGWRPLRRGRRSG